MSAEFLKQEIAVKLNQIKSSLDTNTSFLKLEGLGYFVGLNFVDRVLNQDTPEVIVEYAYLLVLRFYIETGYSCSQVDSLFSIWLHVIELKASLRNFHLQEMKKYSIKRLKKPKQSGEKLLIIQALQRIPELNLDPELVELKSSILISFIDIHLLNRESFLRPETYSGKLVVQLVLETIKQLNIPIQINLVYSQTIHIINSFFQEPVTPSLKQVFLAIFNGLHSFIPAAHLEIQSHYFQYFQFISKYSTTPAEPRTSYRYSKDLTFQRLEQQVKIYSGVLGETKRFPIHAQQTPDAQLSVKELTLENNRGAIKTYQMKTSTVNLDKYFLEIVGSETGEIIRNQFPEQSCFIQYYGAKISTQTNSISLLMEHGGTQLNDFMLKSDQKPCFSEKELLSYFKKILFSLNELKKRGVFNCDLKPGNLMINEQKEVKIIDFSICLVVDRVDFQNFEIKVRGTPGYASPEVALAMKKDLSFRYLKFDIEKSDVFSLGLVFIEMCINEKMTGKNKIETYGQIAQALDKIQSPWARNLIEDMVKFDPSDRPSFQELLDRVNRVEN